MRHCGRSFSTCARPLRWRGERVFCPPLGLSGMVDDETHPGSRTGDSAHPSETLDLLCPRCDYDLRGAPVARCPECGLSFRWDEIVEIRRDFIEYCLPKRRLREVARTWWRAMHPLTFWRWVQLSWPVRHRALLAYGMLLALLTTILQGVVSSSLHFATVHWIHNGSHSLATYAPILLPFYTREAGSSLLPPLIACVLLCLLRGTAASYRINTGHLLRVGLYGASAMLLLPLASASRIVSVLLLYALSPNPDWSLLFWWVVPGGQWSPQVYIHMISFEWFRSGVVWSDALRWLTFGSAGAVLLSWGLRSIRTAGRPWNTFWSCVLRVAVAGLVVLWPVTAVYGLWLCTLAVGTHRYLQIRRGWTVGLTGGLVALLCVALVDPCWTDVILNAVGLWP